MSIAQSRPRFALDGRRAAMAAASVLVCVSILGYIFSHVSLREIVDLLSNVHRPSLLVFFVLSISASIFRAWRYLMLVRLSGYGPPRVALFLVVLIRNFFSDFLPARLGSLIYVFLARTRLGIPLAPAISSFSLAFLFDILALAPILLFAIWSVSDARTPLFVGGAIVLGLGSSGAILLLPAILRTAGQLSAERHPKLASSIESIRLDVERCAGAGIFGRLIALSLVVRGCKYAALYVFLFALLQPLGYALADLPIAKVILGTCSAELAASLPISGIAGFGMYEGTWAVIFQVLGYPAHIARLTGISHHLFTQIYGCLLGGGALLLLFMPSFKVRGEETLVEKGHEPAHRFYAKLAVSIGAVVAAVAGVQGALGS